MVAFDADAAYRLSPFVDLKPTLRGLLAHGALGGPGLALSNPSRLRLVLAFLEPVRPADLLAGLEAGKRPAVRRFLEHCHGLGLFEPVLPGEAGAATLCHWEPHDLRFHLSSRRGRGGTPAGATFHLAGRVPQEPAYRTTPGEAIALTRQRSGSRPEPTLTQALEGRRTRYSVEPLELPALGELLWRTCRVTGEREVEGERFVEKLYPSGGGLHSLEVYVLSARCPGLSPGAYHYRCGEHSLVEVGADAAAVELLLREAQAGTGGNLPDLPSVLLVVASRVRRVTRKYQSLAYSLILKEVGALFQTLYLVATTMDLAACAIGTGNSELFARATGNGLYDEVSVGEIVLGGAPR